jgi:hypothetical protein
MFLGAVCTVTPDWVVTVDPATSWPRADASVLGVRTRLVNVQDDEHQDDVIRRWKARSLTLKTIYKVVNSEEKKSINDGVEIPFK